MHDDADFTLIKFKVDTALLAKAEGECARHGVELFEVVRALIAQIVSDRRIPVDMSGWPGRLPVETDIGCLEMEPLMAQLEGECLMDLVARVAALTSAQIDRTTERKKRSLLDKLLSQALRDRAEIDFSDPVVRRKAIRAYSDLVHQLETGSGL